KKPRKAAKSHTTDLNQAEDIPPLGSAPLPDPQSQNQISGVKERKNHESIDSVQNSNSATSHPAAPRLLCGGVLRNHSRISPRRDAVQRHCPSPSSFRQNPSKECPPAFIATGQFSAFARSRAC